VRIIAIKKLRDFWESGCADSEQPLKVWYQIIKQNTFKDTNAVKQLSPSVSFVGDNRVVFNVSGNKYRLVVYIRYDIQVLYIIFIGTHADYDKINVKKV